MGAHISAETMLDRRLHMVNGQLRTGGIVDKALLAAFLETPRQRFVAPEYESLAYLDRELPARGAATRKLMEPLTLARMLQAAAVVPGDRVLDVGGRVRLLRGPPRRHGREGDYAGIRLGRGGGGKGRTQGPGECRWSSRVRSTGGRPIAGRSTSS